MTSIFLVFDMVLWQQDWQQQSDLEGICELDFQLLEIIQLGIGLDMLQGPTGIYFTLEGKGEKGSWRSSIAPTLAHQHQLGCLQWHTRNADCLLIRCFSAGFQPALDHQVSVCGIVKQSVTVAQHAQQGLLACQSHR